MLFHNKVSLFYKPLFLFVDFEIFSHHEFVEVAHYISCKLRVGLANVLLLVVLDPWKVTSSDVLKKFLLLNTVLLLNDDWFATAVGVVDQVSLKVVEQARNLR